MCIDTLTSSEHVANDLTSANGHYSIIFHAANLTAAVHVTSTLYKCSFTEGSHRTITNGDSC